MEKLAKSGALQGGGPGQNSAPTQLVGKTLNIKEKPVGNTAALWADTASWRVRT